MAHRTLEPTSNALSVSGRIACKAANQEKPYQRLERCAQNYVDWLAALCDFLPCEDCPAKCEEYDLGFRELCQLCELVNYWGCMEGALGVSTHKQLHMESF